VVAFLLAIIVVFILLGVPIAISLGLGSVTVLVLFAHDPVVIVSQKLLEIGEHFPLIAIPMFIFAGFLMDIGGLSERIVRAVAAVLGFVRGGLSLVAVVTCMLFAGVSGSAVADAAAVGAVVLRPMKERGYDPAFSACLIGAAGTIGPIIPPSIPFIIFGVVTGTSITELFLAGVIPGLLIGLSLLVVAYWTAVRRNYPREPLPPFRTIMSDLLAGMPAIFMMVIILGGILGGIFTATEASVAAVVYSLLIGVFLYRSLGFRQVYQAMLRTIDATVIVLWLISCASLLSWILTSERVPDRVAEYLISLTTSPTILLVLIAVLYLVVGMLIDMAPAILMLVPILFPVATKLGIDPVHLGVVTVVGLAIGLITPPTAPTLMITANIAGVGAARAFRSITPMLLAMVAVLFLIVLIPSLALWLPGMVRN
jgi:C4-dicarboxylate transporter, DctM subunit